MVEVGDCQLLCNFSGSWWMVVGGDEPLWVVCWWEWVLAWFSKSSSTVYND